MKFTELKLDFDELLARRAQLLEEEFARQGRTLTDEERQRFGLPSAQRKQREQK